MRRIDSTIPRLGQEDIAPSAMTRLAVEILRRFPELVEWKTLAGYAVLRRPHPDQGLIHRPTQVEVTAVVAHSAPLVCRGR